MADNLIKKVLIPGNTVPYEIASKYIQAGTLTKTWDDIIELVSTSFDIKAVWTATDYAQTTAPTAAQKAKVPAGARMYYNSGANYTTGTLAASADTKNIIYLVYHSHKDSDTFDEYITTAIGDTPTYGWEEIGNTDVDLSNYVQKGTYTTSTPSTNTTSSAGAQTATGTATITYDKADSQTGLAGEATINGSNFGFTGTKATLTATTSYQPAGTVSKPNVTLTTATDPVTYVTGGTKTTVLTGVKGSGTATVVKNAIKGVTLTASTTDTDGPAYVQSISGNAPTLTGITTFLTAALGSASFDVDGNGVLSLSTSNSTSIGTVGISGGEYTQTTRYMKATGTALEASDKVDVLTEVTSDGTVDAYTTLTTATFALVTGAALAEAPTFTGDTATITVTTEYTPAGNITGSQTVPGHTHSIGSTPTEVTGTAAVAVSGHTHDLGNHTHSVDLTA